MLIEPVNMNEVKRKDVHVYCLRFALRMCVRVQDFLTGIDYPWKSFFFLKNMKSYYCF